MLNCSFGRPVAYARLNGSEEYRGLIGDVYFYPDRGGCIVSVRMNGLPSGSTECGKCRFFAFHIHEGGACTGEGFQDAGMHYDPGSCSHPNHAGDLPPLLGCNGRAFMAVLTERFTPWDVIGKTVIVHEGVDDFTCQPAGNAGKRIACGVISPM